MIVVPLLDQTRPGALLIWTGVSMPGFGQTLKSQREKSSARPLAAKHWQLNCEPEQRSLLGGRADHGVIRMPTRYFVHPPFAEFELL